MTAALWADVAVWQWAIAALELGWVAVLSGFILLEKRSPMSTLAWILGLLFVPFLGIAVYFLLGPPRLKRKRIKLLRARESVAQAIEAWERVPVASLTQMGQLTRLATRLGALPPETAVSLRLFSDGDSTYDAILADVAAAKKHVHVEYYIFADDPTGARFRDALVERAKAGVEVRLLVDAIGSASLRSAFFDPLRAAGAKVATFNPPLFRTGQRLLNFRTHRKIVVVDGTVGYTGGINVCDDHSARASGAKAWRDTHLRVEGAAVHGLQRTFLENWTFCAKALDQGRFHAGTIPEFFPRAGAGDRVLQVVAGGPDQEVRAIHAFTFAALAGARERIWITTPYFVPDEGLLQTLVAAALRGVDVQLVLPARTDSALVDAASASFHDPLLQAGVRIHLFGPPMIHAKTCLVDSELAIVGTANLDARSLRLNFEVIVAAYDGVLNGQLAALFEQDRARSRERKSGDARLPLSRRLGQAAARLLAPQL